MRDPIAHELDDQTSVTPYQSIEVWIGGQDAMAGYAGVAKDL